MTAEKPSPGAAVAAFEKVPFENDSSILWKHVSARRFRFVYHYHPEIELIHFVDGEGVEFVGDSSQTFKAGHLVLLGSNLPHFWVNDAECQYAEACVIQFKPEIFGEYLLLLPELARLKSLIEVRDRLGQGAGLREPDAGAGGHLLPHGPETHHRWPNLRGGEGLG
jgi:hypothetical protein